MLMLIQEIDSIIVCCNYKQCILCRLIKALIRRFKNSVIAYYVFGLNALKM